jgi:hypothetical protein
LSIFPGAPVRCRPIPAEVVLFFVKEVPSVIDKPSGRKDSPT